MTFEPTTDHGQTIDSPAGKVIGFFNRKTDFEAFADAVRDKSGSATKISALYGDEGIHLLERLKKNSFFFSDSEDSVIQQSVRELEQGHYAVAVDVTDQKQALQIASLAKPHDGHGFSYFGIWVTEILAT